MSKKSKMSKKYKRRSPREEVQEKKSKSQEVVFGRKPLIDLKGYYGLLEHWAVRVGSTWYEVAGPECDQGKINMTNKEMYIIKPSKGLKAKSGAKPGSLGLSLSSIFWPGLLSAIGGPAMAWALGGSSQAVFWQFIRIVTVAYLAEKFNYYVVVPSVGRLFGLKIAVVKKYGTASGSMLLLAAAALFIWKVTLGGGLGGNMVEERVEAVLVVVWAAWLLSREGKMLVAVWCGEMRDTMGQGYLGTTTRTDEEKKAFNIKFRTDNPKYQVYSVNCQLYVRSFVAFLFEDGKQIRHLPNPQSLGSLILSNKFNRE